MDDKGEGGSCSGNQSMEKINISHSPVTHGCLLIAYYEFSLKLSVVSLPYFLVR